MTDGRAAATRRALVVRHTPSEGIAGFRAPIEAAGYTIDLLDITDPENAEVDFTAADLLVVMGGPMGVYQRAEHPWIDHEVARLGQRIALGRSTLGVCLGAQMVAAAMGARVYPGTGAEIGFAPVALSAAGAASPLEHLAGVPLLHWHGDTFDLPGGVELLASTDRYAHQAFRRGPNLLALQFHPEMGEDPRITTWIEEAGAGLDSPEQVAEEYRTLGPAAVAAGRRMIAEWLDAIEDRGAP